MPKISFYVFFTFVGPLQAIPAIFSDSGKSRQNTVLGPSGHPGDYPACYPPGDNAPENTQRITITHFDYFLLLDPSPKRLGDNGVWKEGVGRALGGFGG